MKPWHLVAGVGVLAAVFVSATTLPLHAKTRETRPKVIVVGFDGMDPKLCEHMMDRGELPNLSRMRATGGYRRLGTTIPPQSPVAWATFITGANPGVHGIFDFVHRDPSRQCMPYYSAAETIQSQDGWEVGKYRIPLTFWPFNDEPSRTVLRRGGTPFWDYLDKAGVPVWLYVIPSNYPPSPSPCGHTHCLAGMGVTDLMGEHGGYQFFTESAPGPSVEPGGFRRPLRFEGDTATARLLGPEHPYLRHAPGESGKHAEVKFTIYRHPDQPSARIELQGETVVLAEGEWSDWCTVDFDFAMPPFLPNSHAQGICRFYLQQVRPTFRLYVTPINIDPRDPEGQRISEPPGFVTEIAEELGPFYTTGFQEDHKARTNHVFTDAEYLRQANIVLDERYELLDYARRHFDDGFLFFYFSSTDLQAHMFWWDSDAPHPIRSRADAKRYHQVIVSLYKQLDEVVGDVVAEYGDQATIFVISDHGFCTFRRQFNLNTWLRENGYIRPANCRSLMSRGPRVDWTRTRAYGLGINGLYVNLRGRERDGIVDPQDRDALLDEISAKLLALRDPLNDEPVIASVYRAEEVYSGARIADAPDLIIGYNCGYRASWDTTLGDMPEEWISDNPSPWSADHCVAAEQVPGVIFANRPIPREHPALVDMAPTILEAFQLPKPDGMTGESVFHAAVTDSVPAQTHSVKEFARAED